MQPSTCEVCGQPADIHDTIVRYRAPVVRHLCRAHGLPLWRSVVDLELARLERSLAGGGGPQHKLHQMMAEFRRHASHSDE